MQGNPDAASIARLADAAGKLRFSTPELEELTSSLAQAVKQRPNAFSPRNLSQVYVQKENVDLDVDVDGAMH